MYNAKPFSDEIAEQTKTEWENQIEQFTEDEDVVLANEYRARLRHALEHENENSARGYYYGLVEDGKNYAQALLEITYRDLNASPSELKLLDIHLEPDLDVENRHGTELAIDTAVKVLVAGVMESLQFTNGRHPAGKLKIYGRGERMMTFLQSVAKSLKEQPEIADYYDVRMESNWLVLEDNE